MADEFSLRCYCYLDRMQPQYAAFVGTVTQGDLPVEGMASLYVEMAPGNEVFRVVDIAVKATESKPGAQIVEREFGMFEVHSLNQAAVQESGRIVLERLGLKRRTASGQRSSPSRSSPGWTRTRPSCLTASGAAACWSPGRLCSFSSVRRQPISIMLVMRPRKRRV